LKPPPRKLFTSAALFQKMVDPKKKLAEVSWGRGGKSIEQLTKTRKFLSRKNSPHEKLSYPDGQKSFNSTFWPNTELNQPGNSAKCDLFVGW